MTPAAPQAAPPPPSVRLRRAAQAERAELERHRRRLLGAREDLRAELARVEAGLAEVDERRRLLDRLAPAAGAPDADTGAAATSPPPGTAAALAPARLLRGPAIRATAVRVLAAHPDIEALHYRDWYGLVTGEGFEIGGKDPLAVFLSQVSRSPVIRKGTQAGVYELDREAPARLRQRLERGHDELRRLPATPTRAADMRAVRARRDELNAEIGRLERALEEADRLLDAPAAPQLVAVG